jgi:hypothetical protein
MLYSIFTVEKRNTKRRTPGLNEVDNGQARQTKVAYLENDTDRYYSDEYYSDEPDLCEVDKIESARPASFTDHALTEIQNERILLSRNPQSVQYEVGMKRLATWEQQILDKQLEDNADAFIAADRSDWDMCCKTSYLIGRADSTIERSELLSREITATKAKFEPPLSKDEEDLMWAAHYEQQMQQEYEAYSYEIDNEA